MTIPEGTQSGRQFRLRGKGMPVLARRTAMSAISIVEVAVETPVKLCKRQKELLREFDKLNEAGCNARIRRLPGQGQELPQRGGEELEPRIVQVDF